MFMTTFSGRRVNPTAPQASDICLTDIAHGLSQLCRFTGHTRQFYSVAQHCVLASQFVAEEFALEEKLHDASEAYINDLSRPLKHHPLMSAYVAIEENLEQVIRLRFGLPATASPEVKRIDSMLVCDEAISLLTEHTWTAGHERLGIVVDPWTSDKAQAQFFSRFFELQG
jgi:hypothetical protein